MNDPSEKEISDDLHKSMALFKRAEVGPVVDLTPIGPGRVLLALDGSAEDEQVEQLGRQLQAAHGCELAVLDAREHDDQQASQHAREVGQRIGGEVLAPEGESGFDRILAACQTWQAEMIILTCPFGRSFDAVGADSTGTIIDVLLARSSVPLLAVRSVFDLEADVFDSIRISLSGENPVASLATRWSLGLLTPGGKLTLSLRVPQDFFEKFRDTMETLEPGAHVELETLENALAQKYSGLHSQLLHLAREHDFKYEFLVHHDQEDRFFAIPEHSANPPLLVLALADRGETGGVVDMLRHCPHPVLIVGNKVKPAE